MNFKEYDCELLDLYKNHISNNVIEYSTSSLLIPLERNNKNLSYIKRIYPLHIESKSYFKLNSSDKKDEYKKIIDELIKSPFKIEFILTMESDFFKYLPQYFTNEYNKSLKIKYVSQIPIIHVDKYECYSSYLLTIKKKRRDDLKRIVNKLDKNFNCVELEFFEQIEDFDNFINMHIDEWGGKGDPSIFNEPKYVDYYKSLFLDRKMILAGLCLDGKVVSYHLGIEDDGVFYYLIPTFNEAFRSYSVGLALLLKLTEHYISLNYKTINLGAGVYPYKQWLANDYLPMLKITIKRNVFSFLSDDKVMKMKLMIKKILKKIT